MFFVILGLELTWKFIDRSVELVVSCPFTVSVTELECRRPSP